MPSEREQTLARTTAAGVTGRVNNPGPLGLRGAGGDIHVCGQKSAVAAVVMALSLWSPAGEQRVVPGGRVVIEFRGVLGCARAGWLD